MKTLIAMFLCIAAIALAQTNKPSTNGPTVFMAGKGVGAWTNKEGIYCISNLPPTAPEIVIKRCREGGTLTNLVNALVADGSFCQVRGHKWEFGPGGVGTITLLYEQWPKPTRNCAVCGLVQTQEVGPWK